MTSLRELLKVKIDIAGARGPAGMDFTSEIAAGMSGPGFVNLLSYGSGATTDWSPILEEAVADVMNPSGLRFGRALYLPRYDYDWLATATLSCNGPLTIWCDQQARILVDAAVEGKVVKFLGASGVSWLGGILDTSARPNLGPVPMGQAWDSLSFESDGGPTADIEVSGVRFIHSDGTVQGGGDSSIFIAENYRARVKDCLFIGCPDAAIYLSGDGVTAETARDTIVRGCMFLHCASACETKRSATGLVFSENFVRNCDLGVAQSQAGTTDPLYPGRRSIIANNHIYDTKYWAITLRGSDRNIVANNIIEGFTDTSTYDWRGINVQGSSKNRIFGNTIKASGGSAHSSTCGIRIESYTLDVTLNSTDNQISGNHVEDMNYMVAEYSSANDRNRGNGNTSASVNTPYSLLGPGSFFDGVPRAFTPVAHGLTLTGSVAVSGVYTVVGNAVDFTIEVQGATGSDNSTSVGNTTYFSSLPFDPSNYAACAAVSIADTANLGTGTVDSALKRIYTPSWSAKRSVAISGHYVRVAD